MSTARWRSLEGLGTLFALALALLATLVVLVAPERQWGPDMWPFYAGTIGVLLWVAFYLWPKLKDRSALPDANEAPADAQDTDTFVRDAAPYPDTDLPQGEPEFGERRQLPDRRR